jgi:phage tail sheath gpL-like
MPISFNLIPNLLLTPGSYIEYDASRAVTGLAALPNRVILIGSRLSTGSVAANTLVQVTRPSDGIDFFGEHSQLARMVEAFKDNSKFTEVWAIGMDDAGGAVAATKTIVVTGTATSAGTLRLLIHGVPVNVAVASGDTPTVIGDSIVAAIAATSNIMFTAANAAGTVTLTARNAAEWPQNLDIRENYEITAIQRQGLPASVSLAFADVVTGTTNPDITAALAAVGAEWFTKMVSGFGDATNVAALESELDDRWGPTVQQDGLAYVGVADTHANLLTYGGARNSQFSTVIGAGQSPSPEAEWAAAYAAVDSNEPDPARPRQTLRIKGVLPPAREDLFTQSERNLLLQGGISTFTADQSGQVFIERMITTYQTNAQSIDDPTFLNVTTMHTLAALRYTLRVRISLKYPRHKLADDGTNYGAGQAIVTPSVIRSEILGLFGQWELNGWVEDFEQFSEELIVERNGSDRDRLDARLGPNLVNQFRVFAGQIQFII